nr:MAG TPA: hypothetical protein [Caudoviricetes sp.]
MPRIALCGIVLCVCKDVYKMNKLQWYQYLIEIWDELLTYYKSLIFLVVRIIYGLQCNAVLGLMINVNIINALGLYNSYHVRTYYVKFKLACKGGGLNV